MSERSVFRELTDGIYANFPDYFESPVSLVDSPFAVSSMPYNM
jgi:hypothetical protein